MITIQNMTVHRFKEQHTLLIPPSVTPYAVSLLDTEHKADNMKELASLTAAR